MIFFLIKLVLMLYSAEVLFRIVYYFKYGKSYAMIPKVPFKKIYVKPHPYLPYVYKKHFANNYSRPAAEYPLNKDKGYYFVAKTSNNLGNFNGFDGGRDVVIPKPEGIFRINCLGASTTGNYIFYNGHDYSYPMELEKMLSDKFKEEKIEVNNFGIGGWTSAEILISFLLNGLDTSPDVVVLHHAYNDLGPSLTPGFQGDYSHAKRNLGERYYLYHLLGMVPFIPLAFYNWAVTRFIGQNINHTLLSSVAKGTVDYDIDFQGFNTYRRNIENIINICLTRNIKIILSTFCFYLHDGIKNNKMHNKLHEGVLGENKIVKELSLKYNIYLVDSYNLIPKEDKYFVDSIHFTPEGMGLLAKFMSEPIIKIIGGMSNDKKNNRVVAKTV